MPHAKGNRRSEEEPSGKRISEHQALAAASPGITLRELAATAGAASNEPSGRQIQPSSFRDLDMLLDQLARPAIFELGKPEPKDRYLPRDRARNCPAAHNRFLGGRLD